MCKTSKWAVDDDDDDEDDDDICEKKYSHMYLLISEKKIDSI